MPLKTIQLYHLPGKEHQEVVVNSLPRCSRTSFDGTESQAGISSKVTAYSGHLWANLDIIIPLEIILGVGPLG